jgi:ABC-type transport system substrate-binding protein
MNSRKKSGSGKRFINISLPGLFAFVSLSLLSGGLFAQPNFSGSWALNESKSTLGDGPRMSVSSMTVNQQEGLISIDLVRPSFDGGDVSSSEKYTLDGKESVNQGMMESSVKTITTWSDDKKELTFAKTILFDMNGETMEFKITEVWSISDDGKTLTVKSAMSSQMGDTNLVLVYDKK